MRARYRGTLLIKNNPPLGTYSRIMPRALVILWRLVFLMSEVPRRPASGRLRAGQARRRLAAYRGTSLIRNSAPLGP